MFIFIGFMLAASSGGSDALSQETDDMVVTVEHTRKAVSRGVSDYQLELDHLSILPRTSASQVLKLTPGIFISNDGGEAHADQIFMRGFNTGEGQDIELSIDGVPLNESGNLHGNGYADTHVMIPELIQSVRVLQGPYDPSQGNFAVAGSIDFHLGLKQPGLMAKYTVGSFQTHRLLLGYSPNRADHGDSFIAAELYTTQGYGSNRSAQRANVMAQYAAALSSHTSFRITATAYNARSKSPGPLRLADIQNETMSFFGTYDKKQGEEAARYSLAATLHHNTEHVDNDFNLFFAYKPMQIRDNFTGFNEDTRGDLIELKNNAFTFGAKGTSRISHFMHGLKQELALGFFARGDIVQSQQQRMDATSHQAYEKETQLKSSLSNMGLFADLNLKLTHWLTLRGGLRGDVLTYHVDNRCHASETVTCHEGEAESSSQNTGHSHAGDDQHVEPGVYRSYSLALMPRASLMVGPFKDVLFSFSVGQGYRSIDPVYISHNNHQEPVATVMSYEGGVKYQHAYEHIRVQASSVLFYTDVAKEMIFNETEGRKTPGKGTERLGNSNALRLQGSFFDLNSSYTYVNATFSNSTQKIPYVPSHIVQQDLVFFHNAPAWMNLAEHPIVFSGGVGYSYVSKRPLLENTQSRSISLFDANVTAAWRFVELGLSIQNLFDQRYYSNEYYYASNFQNNPQIDGTATRHVIVGAPRTFLFSITLRAENQQ